MLASPDSKNRATGADTSWISTRPYTSATERRAPLFRMIHQAPDQMIEIRTRTVCFKTNGTTLPYVRWFG